MADRDVLVSKVKQSRRAGRRSKPPDRHSTHPSSLSEPERPPMYADEEQTQPGPQQEHRRSERDREVFSMQRDAQLKSQPQMSAEDYDRADELAAQHKDRELERFLTGRLVKPWLEYFRCLKTRRGRPQQDVLLQQEAARMFSGEPEIGKPPLTLKEIARRLGFPSPEAARKAIASYKQRNRRIKAGLSSTPE